MKQIIFCILLILLTSCYDKYELSKQKRIKLTDKTEDIVVGVAWPEEDDNFMKGVKLAVKEINRKGVINREKIKLIVNTGENATYTSPPLPVRQAQKISLEVANSFADNPEVISVIGHRKSLFAIPSSVVYQNHGILFLAPTSTNLNLTIHNFSHIFRILPSNEEMAAALAIYCYEAGYKRLVVLHDRGPYATELTDAFVFNAVEDYDAEIVVRRSFFENKDDFTDLIVEIKKIQQEKEFDAIFISTSGSIATRLYKQSRDMNILVPFIGNESLDTDVFWNIVREWEIEDNTEKSVALTVFDDKSASPQVKNFIREYQRLYNLPPDRLSALGYDIINLLSHGIKRARSKIPIRIAEALRYMPFCQGVTGKHEFNDNGDVSSKKMHVKFVKANDEFGYKLINKEPTSDQVFMKECGNIDFDNDDIPDELDACPSNNEVEISQGVYRNGKNRGCPVDKDNDGYLDYKDSCLGTKPSEFKNGIDKYGCPIDTDKDLVPDYKDLCDNNLLRSILVDKDGCAPDEDEDGVPDDKDECLNNSRKEIAKGVFTTGPSFGCPLDSDNDRLPDYLDKCPDNTALEISKGVDVAGCPTDSDRDEIFDYEDICPNSSPQELAKGIYRKGTMKGCSLDSDNDKIPDYTDICPKNSSLEISKGVDATGCPIDTDTDKIFDYQDKCPTNSLAELAKGVDQQGKNSGCPIDSDKDKVPNYLDACPDNNYKERVRGIDAKGCPIDTDKDGVPDYKDRCADTRVDVVADDRGCVIIEVEKIIKHGDDSFPYDAAILTEPAKLELDKIIKNIDNNFLKKIEIICHTDDVGSPNFNYLLSLERTNNVANYLIVNGIHKKRITAIGKGETQPLASNETEEGRYLNRRFELNISRFKRKIP